MAVRRRSSAGTARTRQAKKATAKKVPARKATGASNRGLRSIKVTMPKSGEVQLYASARVATAFKEVFSEDQPLYQSVRIAQIVEAAYQQGLKDGARRAFEEIDQKVLAARQAVPHKNPGRPRKRTS